MSLEECIDSVDTLPTMPSIWLFLMRSTRSSIALRMPMLRFVEQNPKAILQFGVKMAPELRVSGDAGNCRIALIRIFNFTWRSVMMGRCCDHFVIMSRSSLN